MKNAHPSDALLAARELAAQVQRHLEECPRCRVHRRLLLLAEAEEAAPAFETDAEDVGTALDDDGSGNRWLVWDASLGRLVVHVEPRDCPAADHLEGVLDGLRGIEHPHLARVHGIVRREPLRYVRDRIPGLHLGQMDVAADPRASAWLSQAASGLAALHDAGIGHGRVRETSVRITPEGQVQLVDAGLVEADARDDWRALCDLFAALPGPIGAQVNAHLGALDRNEAHGPELLGWLLALRDPGAGGGPRYEPRELLAWAEWGRCVACTTRCSSALSPRRCSPLLWSRMGSPSHASWTRRTSRHSSSIPGSCWSTTSSTCPTGRSRSR